jgi:multidrug efflux pump
MAYAMMGGLAVATVLTLVFLSALYVTWFGIKGPHEKTTQKFAAEKTAIVAS